MKKKNFILSLATGVLSLSLISLGVVGCSSINKPNNVQSGQIIPPNNESNDNTPPNNENNQTPDQNGSTSSPNISKNPSSKIIEEELNRLKNQKPSLIKNRITIDELRNINISNLFTKIQHMNLDTSKFDYSINVLEKNLNNSNKISFNIVVKLKTDSEFKYYNDYVGNFELPYILVSENNNNKNPNKTYFKNYIEPITNGSNYALSTPGKNGEDINLYTGPFKTSPSSDVNTNYDNIKEIVFNNNELNQLLNTFSLGFESYNLGFAFGTGWILDYQIPDDSSTYPTTFYIATNAHVIQNLKIPNDKISPERYEIENEPYYNTDELWIETVKEPKIGENFGNIIDNTNNFSRAQIPASKLKTIFIGNDFLTTSPQDFTKNERWKNVEEYIDFAVMEVTFNSPDEAKLITHDYANHPERHFKYHQKSLLNSENSIKPNYYSILGYPTTEQGSYYRKRRLSTSRPCDKNNQPMNKADQLSNITKNPYYTNFSTTPGIIDAAIGLSYLGYDYQEAYSLKTRYTQWGLMYCVDYGELGEGSSGSMLIDKDGYTQGIYFGGDSNAKVGLAVSLFCEGFNYKGKFGNYNLEGYDLIKGGFPNQKFSYKDNLKKLYGSGFKTCLFPSGLN